MPHGAQQLDDKGHPPTVTLGQQTDMDRAYERAQQHQLAGELAAARALYQTIIAEAPGHPQTLTMLAATCYGLGEDEIADAHVDGAIESYRDWLAHEPGQHGARAASANLLLARQRYAEAETAIRATVLPVVPMRADMDQFERACQQSRQRGLPGLVLNTMPKSASESIWNRLANGLGSAQCYVSLGLFPDCRAVPSRLAEVGHGGVITKEHLPAAPYNLAVLRAAGIDRLVMHIRDPRQATLSWVHFVRDDVGKQLLGPLWRKIVPPARILADSHAAQLDWHLDNYLPLLVDFIDGWRRVEADPAGPAVLFTTFEEFKQDPTAYLSRVLDFAEIDAGLFVDDTEAEVVHLRRGRTDEWREDFTPEQRERAWRAIPADMAARFGWRR